MAKTDRRNQRTTRTSRSATKTTRIETRPIGFPLERENFIIIGIGVAIIIAGYIALAGGDYEGFREITLAPILLTIGYCVVVPFGIFYRKKPAVVQEPPSA